MLPCLGNISTNSWSFLLLYFCLFVILTLAIVFFVNVSIEEEQIVYFKMDSSVRKMLHAILNLSNMQNIAVLIAKQIGFAFIILFP